MRGISSLAPTFAPGSQFAGYRIESVAGSGGMGIVYRATQIALGRPVALKLIAAHYAGDRAFRDRFKREWETAASIDHPNVIPVYEAGEAEEHLFLAMRFVEGIDLANLIARQPGLDPARVVRLFAQVASALDAAHARELIHRDVKPANVLIAAGDHVYLTDFGLTKRASSQSGLTATGVFVGTLDYAAPEQIRGEATDARADVYALGCVLYHALAGRPPFERPSDVAKMYAHLSDPPPAVTSERPDVPTAFDAVIARAMAKDAGERFATAGELAHAARAALGTPAGVLSGPLPAVPGRTPTPPPPAPGSVPAAGVPAPAHTPAPLAPTAASLAAAPAPAESPWPRRRRVALGIALPTVLVGGLAAAALAASGVFSSGTQSPPAATATAPAATATATPTAAATATAPPHAVATIKVGKGPDGVAVSGGRVFVSNFDANTLSVVDPAKNRQTAVVAVGQRPQGVVAGKGVVWVGIAGEDFLQRFDATGDLFPTAKVKVGDRPEAVSLGKQLVWVANRNDATVNRIDRASPSIVGAPIGVGADPAGIFVGPNGVWVTSNAEGTVTRIDPSTAQVVGDPIKVGLHPRGVIEAQDNVWIANSSDGTVTRLNAKNGKPVGEPIRVGKDPRELAFGHGFVWVTNRDDNTVSRIDPNTGRVAGAPIPVGNRPLGIASGAGAIWVANHADHTVTRIQP